MGQAVVDFRAAHGSDGPIKQPFQDSALLGADAELQLDLDSQRDCLKILVFIVLNIGNAGKGIAVCSIGLPGADPPKGICSVCQIPCTRSQGCLRFSDVL